MRRRRGRLVLGGGLLLVLAILTVEAGGRLVLWRRWGAIAWDSTILFDADPVLGYRHHPNGRSFTVRINALGFFFESPDVGAFLWALAREHDGSFVGLSRP